MITLYNENSLDVFYKIINRKHDKEYYEIAKERILTNILR